MTAHRRTDAERIAALQSRIDSIKARVAERERKKSKALKTMLRAFRQIDRVLDLARAEGKDGLVLALAQARKRLLRYLLENGMHPPRG